MKKIGTTCLFTKNIGTSEKVDEYNRVQSRDSLLVFVKIVKFSSKDIIL